MFIHTPLHQSNYFEDHILRKHNFKSYMFSSVKYIELNPTFCHLSNDATGHSQGAGGTEGERPRIFFFMKIGS